MPRIFRRVIKKAITGAAAGSPAGGLLLAAGPNGALDETCGALWWHPAPQRRQRARERRRTDVPVTDASVTDASVTDASVTDASVTDASVTDTSAVGDPAHSGLQTLRDKLFRWVQFVGHYA